jgi:hypothetical protein
MSVSGLPPDERATYLLGLAVRQQLDRAPRDPDAMAEIEAVLLWVEHWLAPEDVAFIQNTTGFLMEESNRDRFRQAGAAPEMFAGFSWRLL